MCVSNKAPKEKEDCINDIYREELQKDSEKAECFAVEAEGTADTSSPRGPPPPLWSALLPPPNPNPHPNPTPCPRRRNPKVLRLPLRLPTPSPPKSM
ncbi:hypothetical protein PoB_004052400 [Plakobranchus ocellatus]|uniref:Uncharacterized protein n=1 Tax=Plakobranchus ocellatus TaxID=259542 RepID=A0AAV4B5P7_9GAST|nr:hypothetical protein PoB_004052400 [Plakobranchus ocellatus]